MRILVTGAAGFIGSHLGERLLREGHAVRGVDCFTDYYPRPMKERNLRWLLGQPGFALVERNLLDADLPELLEGVDAVFHLAAQAGVRASWGTSFEIYTGWNVLATQRLLEACRGRALRRFVYASSSSVYGQTRHLPMREDHPTAPHSPYGVSKLAGEHLAHLYHRNFDVPTISLRFFTVFGPRQRPDMAFHRFLRAGLEGRPLELYGDGEQTRDFTYVDDVVTALVRSMEAGRSGEPYNIGGGNRITVNRSLELIRAVLDREVEVRRSPAQKGDMRHTYADVERARKDLGFQPTVGVAQGLEAELAWLRELPAAGG